MLRIARDAVEVRGTVIRITGKGLAIKNQPKSQAGWRIVELPSWAVGMLPRRREEQPANEWQAVFTSPGGRLRDPSNTQGDLRDVFDRVGYPQITSHTFRRTVATLMNGAGLPARAAADQLGHSKVSMTQDHYFGRKFTSTGAATVLEAMHQTAGQRRKACVKRVWRRSPRGRERLSWESEPTRGLEPLTARLQVGCAASCATSAVAAARGPGRS